MKHRLSRIALLWCAALGVSCSTTAMATDLPTLNLGFTSFLDGTPPAGPGWYGTQYLEYYTASRVNDNAGNKVGLPKQNIDIFAGLSQLVYVSRYKFSGAQPGFDVLLPWVASAHTDDGLGNVALSARRGFGDVLFGPFIQFDPVMGPNGPRFVQRFEFQVIAPTGAYDPRKAINPGSGFWSIDPYWAATVWLSPKWSVSWRLHYLWNARSDRPSASLGDVANAQAGQALHANFATEYEVKPGFRIGVNGYWLRQISDMKVNGQSVAGQREAVWAFGPGAMYSFSKNDHLMFNAYFEAFARNRPEGTRLVLRYVHHFQ